jgi:L-asparaginase type II
VRGSNWAACTLLALLAACGGAIAPASRAPSPTDAGAGAPPTGAGPASARPTVVVVATGGTIAGVQDAPGTLGGYTAGTLTAEQIIASVPPLADYATVEAEQFSNVPSPRITPAQWLGLSRRINTLLRERDDVAGVVVTHGTDRLEETAFFLYLTVRSEKPVVLVGAQRPATGISPDGPINLLSAVRTAAAPASVGKGVVVVMDDRIVSAREVRKHYQRTGGFAGGDMGMLGVVANVGPSYYFAPVRRHGAASEFDVFAIDELPPVDLTFSYPGGEGPRYDTPPAGVVVATTGYAPAESEAYRRLREQGVFVARVFPSGDNANGRPVRPRAEQAADGEAASATPALVAQHLTPAKARILLMLALASTRDAADLQRIFAEY